jgi:hypothetical protein
MSDIIRNGEATFEPKSGGIDINFKRVAARALQYWYIIVLCLIVSFVLAYLVNRYSTRIYTVKASILIKENEENAGAKFLYDNELLNPHRNFYNEIYIMRSYPLLEEVMVSLGFDVSYFREGEIKTTEYYDSDFPVKFHVLRGEKMYGKQFLFKIQSATSFSLKYESTNDDLRKEFDNLVFNDTIKINGDSLIVEKRKDVSSLQGKLFKVKFNNPLSLAKSYSSRIKIDYAGQGASVVNLEISGSSAEKEVDFLTRFIERYQHYDVEKKNKVATMAINFLDEQQ